MIKQRSTVEPGAVSNHPRRTIELTAERKPPGVRRDAAVCQESEPNSMTQMTHPRVGHEQDMNQP